MTTTCYYLEVVSDVPSSNVSGLLTALENVFDARATVLDEGPADAATNQQTPAEEVPETTDTDGTTIPAHVKQAKRIDTSENRASAVDALVNALESNPNVNWYEVRTHDCQHDPQTGAGTGSCSENSVAEKSDNSLATNGSVPGEV